MGNHSTCLIGSCQRHQRCMYTPCRNDPGQPRGVPPVEGPSYHGQPVVVPARQQGKTLAGARERVRKVAEGATINGTYRMFPDDALAEFRNDLILILGTS